LIRLAIFAMVARRILQRAWPRAGDLHRPVMNPPDEKPNPGKEAAKEAKPSRAAEVRRTIEEYANNLREIIRKLRGRLN
jgi:hypothetical protein